MLFACFSVYPSCSCTPRLLSPSSSSSSSSFFVNLPFSNALALNRQTLLLPIGGNNGDHHRPHLPPRPNTSSLSFYHSSSSLRSAQKTLSTHLIHEPDCSPSRRPNVVEILEQRGLLESLTSDNLRSACSDPNLPPLRVYCGFDPTAESLHLGNLLGIIVLSWFLRCGHKAVALVGGATGRVGDPSGKSLERPELDPQTLERNTNAIAETVSRILSRNAINPSAALDGSFLVLDNYDWWKDFKLLDFLKEVGRFARVGAMMSKESVKRRLESEQGMSYTEFSYQLLQGYDFVYLFEQKGVNVQIGGNDQWGNITAGTDLIRRILQADGAYGLTFPLLLKSDGTKFGKSEEGALWLSPSMLSPYKFYQHFFSVPDADVARLLKALTFLCMEEIGELERKMQRPAEYMPNTAQRRLAEEVTRFVHGEEGLEEAVKATEALRPGAETRLDRETIERIAAGDDVPSCSLPYNQVLSLTIVDLSVCTGLLDTKSAARRLLKQGGLYLNNARVDAETKRVEAQDIVDGKILLLSAGRKNKMVVRVIKNLVSDANVNCLVARSKIWHCLGGNSPQNQWLRALLV
ncbi:tyrosine--tRNA ligase [Sarracenia purpurea var. burkii]